MPCWVLLYGGQRWPLPVTLSGTALFALGLVGVPLAMARGHGRRRQDRAAIIGDTLLGASWVLFTWSVLLGVLLRPALAVAGAGHTHGGQIWPFHHLVRLDQPALAGLSRHGARTLLYTSRGTGFWGPPFRFFAPGEITLLVLRSPHPPASS